MVMVLNNQQLQEQEKKDAALHHEAQEAAVATPVIASLAAHIRTCWEKAKAAKTDIETQMLANLRQRNGQYSVAKLAEIAEIGQKPVFMMITKKKCRHAKDWINDILFQAGSVAWDIEPTPVPDLPVYIKAAVKLRFFQQMIANIGAQAIASGQPVDPQALMSEVEASYPDFETIVEKVYVEKAKEIAKRMRQKIDDQLTEGGFYVALAKCIPDIVTLLAGFVKGPINRKEITQKVVFDPATKRSARKVETKIIPQFDKVSPFDIFPAPNSTGINDGYLIERISMTGLQISSLIGTPGYDEPAIRAVLDTYGQGGLKEWTTVDQERAELEGQGQSSVIWDSDKIQGLEFWGSVQGKILLQWGMKPKEVPDPDRFYNVDAILIGQYVIKSVLNENPTGDKPYSKASFDDSMGGFWGEGLPQSISDVQDICNAAARAIVSNVGIAAGPQIERNMERAMGSSDIYPFKVWDVTNDIMATNTPALRFYDIPMVSNQLLEVYIKFSEIADEHSGVPAYAHGGENVGGAGDTASGLSMLMTSAARGIKGVIKAIDNGIIQPTVERQYYANIDSFELAHLIADYKIVAKGSSSLIAKEQQAVRRNEFLQMTQNPIDLSIMGVEGRKYLLKDAGKALEIDVDKAFPETPPPVMLPGQTTTGPPGVPGQVNQSLTPAGEPVAGQDFNTFQNQPRGGKS